MKEKWLIKLLNANDAEFLANNDIICKLSLFLNDNLKKVNLMDENTKEIVEAIKLLDSKLELKDIHTILGLLAQQLNNINKTLETIASK